MAALTLKCVEYAMQVTYVIKYFDAYSGRFSVPSFDAVGQAHKLVHRALSECQHSHVLRNPPIFFVTVSNLT